MFLQRYLRRYINVPVQATKPYGRSRGIATLILNLGVRGNITPWAALPPGKNTGTYRIGSKVGPRADMDVLQKRVPPTVAGSCNGVFLFTAVHGRQKKVIHLEDVSELRCMFSPMMIAVPPLQF